MMAPEASDTNDQRRPVASDPGSDPEHGVLDAARLAIFDALLPQMTHDLNQPIGIALLTSDAALLDIGDDTVDAERLDRNLRTICQQMDRMGKQLESLMILGRMNRTSRTPFDPTATASAAFDCICPLLKSADIAATVSMPDGAVAVTAHQGRLLLAVVASLLASVRRLGPRAGPQASTAEFATLVLHGDWEADTFTLELVCEAGTECGPPDEASESDLLLRAASVAMADIGGRFDCTLEPDYTVVQLSVPLDQPAAEPSVEADGWIPGRQAEPVSTEGLELLVVDDEEYALAGISDLLTRRGHHVVLARNGAEGLKRFEESRPDVVITDLRMPTMDGQTMIRRLREKSPAVPIVVMTGHASPEVEAQVLADGVLVVLRKPVRIDDLMHVLAQIPVTA